MLGTYFTWFASGQGGQGQDRTGLFLRFEKRPVKTGPKDSQNPKGYQKYFLQVVDYCWIDKK